MYCEKCKNEFKPQIGLLSVEEVKESFKKYSDNYPKQITGELVEIDWKKVIDGMDRWFKIRSGKICQVCEHEFTEGENHFELVNYSKSKFHKAVSL